MSLNQYLWSGCSFPVAHSSYKGDYLLPILVQRRLKKKSSWRFWSWFFQLLKFVTPEEWSKSNSAQDIKLHIVCDLEQNQWAIQGEISLSAAVLLNRNQNSYDYIYLDFIHTTSILNRVCFKYSLPLKSWCFESLNFESVTGGVSLVAVSEDT